jgi:hypothetical protein
MDVYDNREYRLKNTEDNNEAICYHCKDRGWQSTETQNKKQIPHDFVQGVKRECGGAN